jgi:hypothetical protein
MVGLHCASCIPEATFDAPEIVSIAICEDINWYTEEPIGLKNHFTSSDIIVYVYFDIYNGADCGPNTLACRWFSPGDVLEQEFEWVLEFCDRDYWYCGVYIVTQVDYWNARMGQWRIETWFNGVLVATNHFVYG